MSEKASEKVNEKASEKRSEKRSEKGRYQCQKCGERFDEIPKGVFRCPTCAYKVIIKLSQPVLRTLKAE